MNLQHKEAIIKALEEKNVSLPCPRCNSSNFQVIGQTTLSMSENPRVVSLGGAVTPAALITCSQCGFITLHALGALGHKPNSQPNHV